MNENYGCTKPHQHEFENDLCKKCRKHVKDLKLKLCAVIGKDEMAEYRWNNE